MTKAIGIRLEKYVFSEAVIVVVVLVRLLAIASRARVLYVCLCRCLYGSFTARAAILAGNEDEGCYCRCRRASSEI